jgi:cellulose synthase/poly-beta-1,6-N-acetylglucosamine synthase-like glycosyltransferase
LINLGALCLLTLALVCLIALILLTMRPRSWDDRGDGKAKVILPPPARPNTSRLTAFLLLLLMLSLLVATYHVYGAAIYDSAVLRLALWVYPSPASLNPYYTHLEPSLRLMLAGSFFALAPVVRSDPLRRLAMAAHSLLYLAIAIPTDALLVSWAASTRLPIGFYGLEGVGINLAIGGLALIHLFFTTWQLPRPTVIPVTKGVRRRDNLEMALVLLAVLASFGILVAFGAANIGTARPIIVLLAFTAYSVCWTLIIVFLGLLRSFAKTPPVGDDFPPMHVILPAYNEASGITTTLRSIDAAAQNYPGEIRLTVANDGSTDDTLAVVSEALAEFTAAQGEVITVPHGGKSVALNAALARVRTELCIRIDSDVVLDSSAFLLTPRWFRDPNVGLVGGGTVPQIGGSWIHRMRLFECLSSFYFARPGLMAVDGISCIPGTFQAFRVAPARAVGGNVEGMNGEDADLTLQLGRLGYRAVIDLQIRVYEDAPNNIWQLREQRVRWYRAGSHIFARHGRAFAMAAGPKIWFNTVRLIAMRFLAVLRPVLILYILVLALQQPTPYRNVWFVFLLYGASVVPTFLVCLVMAFRYGFGRYLPWFVLWYPLFVVLRRLIVIESFISIPTRPGLAFLARPGTGVEQVLPSSGYQELG